MKLEYFYYMVEIVKTGSISKAAENLSLSQPYLSLECKNLERKMNVSLLIRNSRGVALTPAGEKFIEYAHDILQLVSEVKNINEFPDIIQNKLSISSMYSFTFLDLYDNFSAMYNTKTDIVVYEEIPNDLIPNKVRDNSTDIGITYIYHSILEKTKKEFDEKNLYFKPLVKENLSIVVNRHHPLAKHTSVSLDQIKKYEVVFVKRTIPNKAATTKNSSFQIIREHCTVKQLFFDNNRSVLYYITKNKSCFAVGQKSLNITNPFVVSGEIVYIPIKEFKNEFITGYLINENTHISKLGKAFISYIENYFNEYNAV